MVEPETDSLVKAETRQRLLEAAGEVFAEVGFAKATVRDICRQAGANVAAVNYHFRDKEGLYVEVVRFAQQYAMTAAPPAALRMESATPEEQLRLFIRTFLFGAIGKGRLAWHGKMMAREMSEPTGMLDRIVTEVIRPRATMLEGILRRLLGPSATQWRIEACARSVVSQCLFYHLCRPVIDRLHPTQKYEPEDVEQLADHIATFSIGALRAIANSSST